MDRFDNEFLKGAYDLHLHIGPDTRPRKVDDIEMAERAVRAGMRGFGMKSHVCSTAERAALIRKQYPGLNAVGVIALNYAVGGINPVAVETMAKEGGRLVYFPTCDALQDVERLIKMAPEMIETQIKLREAGILSGGLTVFDADGALSRETLFVLEVIRDNDLTLCTGHIAPEETFALVTKAHEMGVRRMIVTHVDWPGTFFDIPAQQRLVELGCMLEHAYTSPCIPYPEAFAQIKATGPAHNILVTDLGQISLPEGKGMPVTGPMPYPDEGLKIFARMAFENGISYADVRRMVTECPAAMVE